MKTLFSPVIWAHAVGYVAGAAFVLFAAAFMRGFPWWAHALVSCAAYFASKYLAMLVDNG